MLSYDAFHDTNLCELLSCAGVSTVLIGGVLTNLCCETTARSAFVRDFNVLFLTDGTAARHSYMHDATLINIVSAALRDTRWSYPHRLLCASPRTALTYLSVRSCLLL